jgi:nitroimidazol reductase NimA-like FMN-containing flavoprotein (pyridoxamine 5'-phosphate oxidase superfamily)
VRRGAPTRRPKTHRPHRAVAPRASRPRMPGYGLPRSRKGLLPWAWAERRLVRSHNYWLITVRPNGRPHAMPVWGIWVDGAFYFSTGRESRKARNLVRNRRCIVCNERADEAVIVEGEAREIRSPEVLARLARPYHAKYKPWKLDPALGPIYAVRPRVVLAVHEKRFPDAATRWRF